MQDTAAVPIIPTSTSSYKQVPNKTWISCSIGYATTSAINQFGDT